MLQRATRSIVPGRPKILDRYGLEVASGIIILLALGERPTKVGELGVAI
ncbi:MAG TPA: hypothetical protein VIJ63_08720 [Roseiarcus sp.]